MPKKKSRSSSAVNRPQGGERNETEHPTEGRVRSDEDEPKYRLYIFDIKCRTGGRIRNFLPGSLIHLQKGRFFPVMLLFQSNHIIEHRKLSGHLTAVT